MIAEGLMDIIGFVIKDGTESAYTRKYDSGCKADLFTDQQLNISWKMHIFWTELAGCHVFQPATSPALHLISDSISIIFIQSFWRAS